MQTFCTSGAPVLKHISINACLLIIKIPQRGKRFVEINVPPLSEPQRGSTNNLTIDFVG
jgi:hypothetical protein